MTATQKKKSDWVWVKSIPTEIGARQYVEKAADRYSLAVQWRRKNGGPKTRFALVGGILRARVVEQVDGSWKIFWRM